MTGFGWAAAVSAAVLAAVGLVAGWAPLDVPGLGTLALVAGCGLWAWRRPAVGLERAVQPARVAKGSDAVLVVRACNRSRRPLAALVVEQQVGPEVLEVVLPPLGAGGAATRTYRLPTTTRGVLEVGPMLAVRADPFGLWRRVQRLGAASSIVVGPRVVDLRPLPTGTSRHLEGPSSDASPQGSTTFHRLREYVVGDDLRTVHWPSTARTGTLVVRHQVDTAEPYTVVLLDVRPEVHSQPGFEEAVDVAASVVVASSAGRSPVQVRTTAGSRAGGPGQRDPAPAMALLTAVRARPGGSLEAELALLRRDRGGTALVVVTGRAEIPALRAAASLQRRFERVVVAHITDVAVLPPPLPGVSVIVAADADRFAAAWHGRAAR